MCFVVFFFKQKTAYEMRVSDWSSDVCSSDLIDGLQRRLGLALAAGLVGLGEPAHGDRQFRQGARPGERATDLRGGAGLGPAGGLTVHRQPVHAGVRRRGFFARSSEERLVGSECVSTFRSRW